MAGGFYSWSPTGGDRFVDSTQLKGVMDIFEGDTPAANGTTAVTVNNANVTANSTITLTLKTVGGTPAGAVCTLKTPGTSFQFKALAAGDTSVYRYRISN